MSNTVEQSLTERIFELEQTIKEAIGVFDRETHQIETEFPEYAAMQRMKRAVGKFGISNTKIITEAKIKNAPEPKMI